MALSDQQMLILDNLMYSNITTNPGDKGKTLEQIIKPFFKENGEVDIKALKNVKLSGGLSKKEMANILNEISQDENLRSLKIDKSIDKGIRGTCFVDESGHATVAFRGTGGFFSQWKDNIEAFGDEVTPSQQQAKDFINSLKYDNIDVTGHSKGGNLAKFVTVVCGDKIGRCVSYEGQGFSLEFHKRYKKQIKENRKKIKQISDSRDAVNVLLIDVTLPKNNHYIKNSRQFFDHGSYKIYKAKGLFDKDGNYSIKNDVPRSIQSEILYKIIRDLCFMDIIDPTFHRRMEACTDLLSVFVALGFANKADRMDVDQDLMYQYEKIKIKFEKLEKTLGADNKFCKNMRSLIDSFGNWLEETIRNQINPGIKYSEEHTLIEVDTDLLRDYANRIARIKNKSHRIDDRIAGLYTKVGLLDLLKLLDVGIFDLTQSRLGKVHSYLIDTAEEFESVESELSGV